MDISNAHCMHISKYIHQAGRILRMDHKTDKKNRRKRKGWSSQSGIVQSVPFVIEILTELANELKSLALPGARNKLNELRDKWYSNPFIVEYGSFFRSVTPRHKINSPTRFIRRSRHHSDQPSETERKTSKRFFRASKLSKTPKHSSTLQQLDWRFLPRKQREHVCTSCTLLVAERQNSSHKDEKENLLADLIGPKGEEIATDFIQLEIRSAFERDRLKNMVSNKLKNSSIRNSAQSSQSYRRSRRSSVPW
mmetsp:Transcript_16426/g.23011  ORF Transcript_16426/g.23011 Transcript_16426/m.23011 type:complete len:251 (+) Transcript_16426:1121-1873(+)